MPQLTDEQKDYIDEKLKPVMDIKSQVNAIHQFILGFEGHGGAAKIIEEHECKIDDHELRIKKIESIKVNRDKFEILEKTVSDVQDDKKGKIEIWKALIAVIGSFIVAVAGGGGILFLILKSMLEKGLAP